MAVLFLCASAVAWPLADARSSEPAGRLNRLPHRLAFEPNLGQAEGSVKYLARAGGYVLLLGDSEARFQGSPVRLRWMGANRAPRIVGEELLPGKSHYFLGRDPGGWRTGVPQYSRVRYRGLYPGIDLVYYGAERSLEFDVVVARGADPGRIRMQFAGVEELRLDANGGLVLGGLRLQRPRVYQQAGGARREVAGRYVRLGRREAGVQVGRYDRSLPLVIDPVLTSSTYLGGSGIDSAAAVAVDGAGYIYVAGQTDSANFPVTPGAYRTGGTTGNPPGDVFVTKLDPTGTAVVYSTYFGGSRSDAASAMAVDAQGNVFVTGHTESTDFPTTLGAFQLALRSAPLVVWGDAFVTKLNASGSGLVYSTYLGGAGREVAAAIAVGPGGDAFVTGWTDSPDFPRAGGPLQSSIGGSGYDAFVTRLNSTGTAQVYSTYLGGINLDAGHAIAVDASGAAYVAGITTSPNFPVSPNAYRTSYAGGDQYFWYDGFVTKLNPAGNGVVFSTLLGGSRHDVPRAIAVDAAGSVYVAGETNSTDFPVTAGAFQSASPDGGSAYDAFVAKLDASGSSLVWSTYLGGKRVDLANALAVDASLNVTVAGETESLDFPVAGGAGELSGPGGQRDAFLTRLNASGSTLVYSMYLGGSQADRATGLAVDSAGNAYVVGQTSSPDFPVTSAAIEPSARGAVDGFFARIAPAAVTASACVSAVGVVNAASQMPGPVSAGELVTLYGTGLGPGQLVGARLTADRRMDSSLAGTRVFFDNVPAPLIYVSATQVGAIVPYSVAGKASVELRVESATGRTNTVRLAVAASAPGLFTLEATGRGQGAILHPEYSVNGPGNPAERGSAVILYATGEGQTDPGGTDGKLAVGVYPRPRLPVSVRIGGLEADVWYAGAAPGLVAGALQVNVKVPETVAAGAAVPVILKIGDRISQPGVTLAVR